MKKRLLSLGLAALMAASLTACGGSDAGASSAEGAANSTEKADAAGGVIQIGGIGPITGGAAVYGIAVQNGAQLAVDEINAAMKAASNESFGYNTDEIVSSDIVGMRFGSLFDATQTMVCPLDNGTTEVQVVSWYDNENSYTSQMVRTIKYFSELA